MIRAIRPSAMAQDDASLITGWNVSPNVGYTMVLTPGATACGVLLFDADMTAPVASGAGLVGTGQPVILLPQTGQTIGMVDADLGWHLLLTTTGTEAQQTIRIGPAVDLPDEIHPIYADDDMAMAKATAAINAGASYVDDVTVTCPLGLGASIGAVASVPVDGVGVVGQVESITWTGTPDGAREQAVIRRHVAIAPEPHVDPVPVTPPTVADDTAETDAATEASGNVLANDESGLTVVAVNGLAANVGVDLAGDNGGVFTVASDGGWAFDPDGDFALLTGSETADTSVTYYASDGVSEALATLTVTVSSTAAAPWTPADITTALYCDINGATSGASIPDLSGSSRIAAQGTALKQPTLTSAGLNGHKILSFDGVDDVLYIASNFIAVQPLYIFAVVKCYSEYGGIITSRSSATDASPGLLINSNAKIEMHGESTTSPKAAVSPVSNTGWTMVCGKLETSKAYLSINGGGFVAAASTFSAFSGTTSNTAIGTYRNNDGNYGKFDLAAIVVISTSTSQDVIDKLFGWAAHEFALTAELPADHPYKSTHPYVE